MQKKYDAPPGRWLGLICLGLLLWACHPGTAQQDGQDTTTSEEATMNLAHAVANDPLTIPPIDRDPPAVYETAAFGMG